MNDLDFTSWTWTYKNDTGNPVRINANTIVQPGESITFNGVASTSQQGAEDFLDSFNSLLNNPSAHVIISPSMDNALRQATEQAPDYKTGAKSLNLPHDTHPNLDPASKDGKLNHSEYATDLYDFDSLVPEDETVTTAVKITPDPDPNIPPPQAPPAGEAEERSKDEEKQITKVADPVNPFTGEFYIEKEDFELPSIGFPFSFIRIYKSGRTYFGPFGYSWDHNYNVYIRELNNGAVAVNTGSLQEDIYHDSGDSILYYSPRGGFSILEKQQGITIYDYIITFKNGFQFFFGRPIGWSHPQNRIPLIKIQDTNGNFQELIYNNNNQLATVIDTIGRRINFIYGQCGLLEKLQPEFLQESGKPPVEIKYMHANNIEQLSAVITFPTPDFPNGLMTCYEYDDYAVLPELRNNILRVIDAKGQTIVENFYGNDTTNDSFNRVVKQYFMCGEYLFNYTNIRYIPPIDDYINDAYLQTEFYESGRPLKLLTFNFRGNLLDERFRLCADGSYSVWAQSYRYNKNGQLTELYYANGMAEFYKYDENNYDLFARGNLLQVDRKSRLLQAITRTIAKFTYEQQYQRVKTAEDEKHSLTEFVYEQELNPLKITGNLVKIKYPDTILPDGSLQNNCEVNFKYDLFGQMIEELSPEGRKKNYEYFLSGNGAGLVKKIKSYDNISPLTKSFEYDAMGNPKRVIDDSGNDTNYEYNMLNQLIKAELPVVNGTRAISEYEYNEDGKVAKEYLPKGKYTDAVLINQFIINEYYYDVASWLVEIKKYSNTEFPQVTKIQRDFFGNPVKIINPIGQEFKYKYDERNLVLEETKYSNAEFPFKTSYNYDRMGNLLKITLQDGITETYNYDDPFTRLKSKTNHLKVTQEFTYGINDELVQKIIKDAAGIILQTHNFSYDKKGRLIKSGVNGLTSQTFYDKDNLIIKKTDYRNNSTKIDYDGVGRTIRIIDPLGNRQTISYDFNGNKIFSGIKTTLNGNNFSINQQIIYDERNRPIRILDPLGNFVTYIYDDRNLRIGVINTSGQQVNLYYDLNREKIKSCLVKGGVEQCINQWNRDIIGRLISFQDAENNIIRYSYDERGKLIKSEYPNNSTITKEYNAFGYPKKERDCNGTLSNFTYNSSAQLIQIDFQVNGGAVATPAITYVYDSFGRNTALSRGTYNIINKYDAFNRIIEETQGIETIKRTFDDIKIIILH